MKNENNFISTSEQKKINKIKRSAQQRGDSDKKERLAI